MKIKKTKKQDLINVSKLWSSPKSTANRYGNCFHWVESPVVKEYINTNITGNKELDWVTYVFNKYLRINSGALRCLSLGCGVGNLERHLLALGFFRSIDAIDISKEALDQAKQLASEKNYEVNYKMRDLNSIKLKRGKYDVVFANMSLHHVNNLESIFSKVEKCLVDDGLFIYNEYVGPNQFQYTKKQIRIINEIIERLPPEYRNRVTDRGVLKPLFMPPSIQYMNENDPSEAIRSAEILKYSYQYFKVLEKRDYGGTILHMLLQDIVGNFDANNPKDRFVLEMITYIENILIREKVISSDFSFLILKKQNINTSFLSRLFRLLVGGISKFN